MSFGNIAKVAILSLSIWQAASAQSGKQTSAPESCDTVRWRPDNERGAQMNDHESVHAIGQSQAKPRTHARAEAKITV